MTANDTVDDATIMLEFIVHLSSTTAVGNSFTVNVLVDSAGTTVQTLDQTITARANILSANTLVSGRLIQVVGNHASTACSHVQNVRDFSLNKSRPVDSAVTYAVEYWLNTGSFFRFSTDQGLFKCNYIC